MKRLYSVILAVIITLVLVACGSGGKKLSGSYECGAYRYEFITSKDGHGEYGGTCNIYSGIFVGTHSWYVEDNIVYLDGDALFGYYPEKDYIYELDSYVDITLYEDKTCIESRIYPEDDLVGTYEIKDGILYVEWEGWRAEYDFDYLIVDNKYYEHYGIPV